MDKVTNKLKQLRIDNNYTQQYVADKLNIALFSYQRYEKGIRQLNISLIYSLCDLYQITPNDLLL